MSSLEAELEAAWSTYESGYIPDGESKCGQLLASRRKLSAEIQEEMETYLTQPVTRNTVKLVNAIGTAYWGQDTVLKESSEYLDTVAVNSIIVYSKMYRDYTRDGRCKEEDRQWAHGTARYLDEYVRNLPQRTGEERMFMRSLQAIAQILRSNGVPG